MLIGDCDVPDHGDGRLCKGDAISAYLADNLEFLKAEMPPASHGAAASDAKLFDKSPDLLRTMKGEFPEGGPDASDGVLDELAPDVAKIEFARAMVFAAIRPAWLTLSAAETTARVFWMSTLGAVTIALIVLAAAGVSTTIRATSRSDVRQVIVLVLGLALGVGVGIACYLKLDLFFLETWPAEYVKRELRDDLPAILAWLYFLLGFGAIALLTGVSMRLVMPAGALPKQVPLLTAAQESDPTAVKAREAEVATEKAREAEVRL